MEGDGQAWRRALTLFLGKPHTGMFGQRLTDDIGMLAHRAGAEKGKVRRWLSSPCVPSVNCRWALYDALHTLFGPETIGGTGLRHRMRQELDTILQVTEQVFDPHLWLGPIREFLAALPEHARAAVCVTPIRVSG